MVGSPQSPPPKPAIRFRSFDQVIPKKVEWLWPDWIPLSKFSVLVGDPGLGKSTVLLDIAARLTTNGVMPDDSQGITGSVVLLTAEDDPEDTVGPRLQAA